MKKLTLNLFLLTVVFFSTNCGSSNSDPLQIFATDVVNSLENKDINKYLSLCGTAEDLIEVLKEADASDREMDKIANDPDSYNRKVTRQRTKEFEEISQDSFWGDVVIDSIVPDKLEDMNGITMCNNLRIYLKGNRVLRIRQIFLSHKLNKWKIAESQPLRFK